MYTFLVVYTKNMYFYFILILYIYINRWREGISGGGRRGVIRTTSRDEQALKQTFDLNHTMNFQ